MSSLIKNRELCEEMDEKTSHKLGRSHITIQIQIIYTVFIVLYTTTMGTPLLRTKQTSHIISHPLHHQE